jgi:hypothetical protein
LILLILIVVLFIVFVIWGHGRNSSQLIPISPENHPDPENDQKHFNEHPHDTLAAFNKLLVPFTPKLQAKQLQPPLTTFDLASIPHYSENILADSSHKSRQAKFAVRPNKSCAHVVFMASGPVPDKMQRTQDSDKANGDNKSSNEFTLTIFEGGGTLTIDRAYPFPAGPCKVMLQ